MPAEQDAPVKFPEQLQSSRVVGHIASDQFPWLDLGEQVTISEAVFPDGKIFIASAIPDKLAKLTEEVRGKDKHVSPDGRYGQLDEFLLSAAHLEANGEAMRSRRVGLLNGRSTIFEGWAIKAYKESPTPNTRRMYYAQTKLETFKPASPHDTSKFTVLDSSEEIDYGGRLLVRLGYADKHNQLEVLHHLTGRSRKELRKRGAGAI